MGIIQAPVSLASQVGVIPATRKMVTTDNLATITAAGYLNGVNLEGFPLSTNDIIETFYSYNTVTQTGTYAVFSVAISGTGVITLAVVANPGDVLLPVVSGDVAIFNGTTGQIKDSNIASTNVMQLNVTNTLAAGASIVANKVNGTEATNAVTASGMSGVITTSSLTTAGGANYAITWTNTFITTTSTVHLSIQGGTNTTENITLKVAPGSGTATLTIYNNTAATALNGTIFIGYLVI